MATLEIQNPTVVQELMRHANSRCRERSLRFTVDDISNANNDSDAKPSDNQTDEVLREWRESAVYWQGTPILSSPCSPQ